MFSLKKEHPKYYSYPGRKVSKKISQIKKKLLNTIYDQYSLDGFIIQYHKKKISSRKITFPKNFQKVNIEIGFGDGEFLLKNAISNPKELFVGVEVYLNGIAKVLKSISDLQIKNIVLSNINGLYLLDAMPDKSVDKIFIINPDPWIKKRHNKRRLLSYEAIKLLTSKVKSRNSIYLTTDSETYLNDIQDILSKNKVHNGDYSMCILSKNDELYGISRYQRKAIKKGGNIYFIKF